MTRPSVFGSRIAVAVASAIVTATVVAGGIALATVPSDSVGTFKIIDNSVRSIDIRDNAVRGVDIRDGGVQVQDLAPAARPPAVSALVINLVNESSADDQFVSLSVFRGAACYPSDVGRVPCNLVVPTGTEAALSDNSGSGVTVEWGGDVASCGTADSCTFTVDDDTSVAATLVDAP